MGVGWEDDRDGREKDRKRDRSGRKKERDRDAREKDRETGAGEREIGRETGVGEREREGGEREKNTNTKKFMEFYLVVLQSGYRSIVHFLVKALKLVQR